jgi:hypothetical protein
MTTASSTVLIFTCAHTAALTLYHMYSSSFVHSPASFTFSYRRWEPGQTKKREPWLKCGEELEHLWRDSFKSIDVLIMEYSPDQAGHGRATPKHVYPLHHLVAAQMP